MPCKREDFPGRGFSWGQCISKKTGLGELLGQVSDNVSFINIHPLMSTYTIAMLHGKFVYGKICIRERIRITNIAEKVKNILYMPSKGKISREEGFLVGGAVFSRKRGFERFWGKCLKQIRVSDNASFTGIQP